MIATVLVAQYCAKMISAPTEKVVGSMPVWGIKMGGPASLLCHQRHDKGWTGG